MAALVEKGSDSGVKLSELTDGELWLVENFMLAQNALIRIDHNDSYSANYCIIHPINTSSIIHYYNKTLDIIRNFEKISTITIKAESEESNQNVRCQYHNGSNWVNANSPSGGTVTITHHFNSTNPVTISSGGTFVVKVISFTTTDGKVHTADNLNY